MPRFCNSWVNQNFTPCNSIHGISLEMCVWFTLPPIIMVQSKIWVGVSPIVVVSYLSNVYCHFPLNHWAMGDRVIPDQSIEVDQFDPPFWPFRRASWLMIWCHEFGKPKGGNNGKWYGVTEVINSYFTPINGVIMGPYLYSLYIIGRCRDHFGGSGWHC